MYVCWSWFAQMHNLYYRSGGGGGGLEGIKAELHARLHKAWSCKGENCP